MTKVSFPCKEALKIPCGAIRKEHIDNCKECQRLWKKMNIVLGR
jgi:hypothetical protein